MTAYEHVQRLGLTGTDDEIAAQLAVVTSSDIPITLVASWLRERQLWILGPNGSAGTLYDIHEATDNATVKAGLAELYASVFGGQAQSLRTSDPVIAARIAGVLAIIKAAIPDGDAIAAEFYGLAGGLLCPGVTGEQVASERTDSETAAATAAALKAEEDTARAAARDLSQLHYAKGSAAQAAGDTEFMAGKLEGESADDWYSRITSAAQAAADAVTEAPEGP